MKQIHCKPDDAFYWPDKDLMLVPVMDVPPSIQTVMVRNPFTGENVLNKIMTSSFMNMLDKSERFRVPTNQLIHIDPNVPDEPIIDEQEEGVI